MPTFAEIPMPHIHYQDGSSYPIHTIFCIGRNYAAHIAELGNAPPDEPIVFLKPYNSLAQSDTLHLPAYSQDVHYESELVVHLGQGGKNIPHEQALACIQGYGLGLDLTARDAQAKAKAGGLPWTYAKGFDDAATLSAFVPAATFPDPADIRFSMDLNGERRQNGHTALMLYPIIDLIVFLSSRFTLHAGDLIYTGTPQGVGKLSPGDHIHLALDNTTLRADYHIRSTKENA